MKKLFSLLFAALIIGTFANAGLWAVNPDTCIIKVTPSYQLSVKLTTPTVNGLDFGGVQTNRYYVHNDTITVENDSPVTGRAIETIQLKVEKVGSQAWDVDTDNTASPDALRIYAVFSKGGIVDADGAPHASRSSDLADDDLLTGSNQLWTSGSTFDPATVGSRYSNNRIPNNTETELTRILYIGLGTPSATSTSADQSFLLTATAALP